MSARAVRRTVLVVCVAGIAGMIAASVADNDGAALTFGLVAAAAVLGLILVTAVAGPGAYGRPAVPDEALGAEVEDRVQALVAAGSDEADLRALVRVAVRLGKDRG